MNKSFLKLLTSLSIAAVLAGCNLIDINNQEEAVPSSAKSSQASSVSSASSSSAAASSVQASSEASEASAETSESSAAESAASSAASESNAESESKAESESESKAESESIAESESNTESESIAAAESVVEEPVGPVAPTINPGYGDWYIEDGTWYQASNPSYQRWVGESAIIVNINAQTMWAVLDGQILIETPITTGKPGEETPRGFYNIQHKESPSVLVGEDYAAPVTYWMPFIGNLYGFHDASWQPAFGGEQYINGYGSRGCINLPYWAAETLYLNFHAGEEVIII